MTPPFRFGVCLFSPLTPADWAAAAGRAEALGFDVVSVADHMRLPAPIPSLLLAAQATERVLLGTYVLNTSLYAPALLARDVAVLDRAAGGRVEIGLGAGYNRAELDAVGLPWTPAADRVSHLERVVDRFRDDEQARIMVAGRGDRVLRLAAARADVISFTGTSRVRRDGDVLTLAGPEDLDDRVALVRGALGERAGDVELNITIQRVLPRGTSEVTDTWGTTMDLGPAALAEVPSLLVGSPAECAERLRERRERFGLTYFTVLEPAMEAFARVVEELR